MLVVAGVLKSEDIENHVDYLRAAIGSFPTPRLIDKMGPAVYHLRDVHDAVRRNSGIAVDTPEPVVRRDLLQTADTAREAAVRSMVEEAARGSYAGALFGDGDTCIPPPDAAMITAVAAQEFAHCQASFTATSGSNQIQRVRPATKAKIEMARPSAVRAFSEEARRHQREIGAAVYESCVERSDDPRRAHYRPGLMSKKDKREIQLALAAVSSTADVGVGALKNRKALKLASKSIEKAGVSKAEALRAEGDASEVTSTAAQACVRDLALSGGVVTPAA